MLCLRSHVFRSYNHFVRLTVLGLHCNQVALRSCSGTWHQKPARRLGVAGVICHLLFGCGSELQTRNSGQKSHPKRQQNSSSDPDYWELRHRSNVKYLRRGRQGHVLPSNRRVTNCLKHSRGNHQSSSSEVYLNLIRPGKFLPIIHPLQLSLFKCLPYNSATLKITCFFISCQYCMVLRQRVFC